jgi:hypothetical protein
METWKIIVLIVGLIFLLLGGMLYYYNSTLVHIDNPRPVSTDSMQMAISLCEMSCLLNSSENWNSPSFADDLKENYTNCDDILGINYWDNGCEA